MMFATNGRKESSGRTLFLIMFTLFCAGGMMLMLQAFENANHRTWADLKVHYFFPYVELMIMLS